MGEREREREIIYMHIDKLAIHTASTPFIEFTDTKMLLVSFNYLARIMYSH